MLNSIMTLIEDIKDGERTFSSLSKSEFKDVYEASIASGDLTVFRMLTNHHTGVYDYDQRLPRWLESEFDAPQWTINLSDKPKIIRWNSVFLNDGKKLTDPKHAKLLNAFKYWITACDNPLENGGKVELSNTTIQPKINRITHLINAILLHSEELKLAENHLLHVDDNFWLNVLSDIAIAGGKSGVYHYNDRIKDLLDKASYHISDEETEVFISDYPHIIYKLAIDDIHLNLIDRQKSAVWLSKQGYYGLDKKTKSYQGNNSILKNLLFEGKCLCDNFYLKNLYPELYLKPQLIYTEYKAIENRDTSSSLTTDYFSSYISDLRLIHTNLDRDDACQPQIIGDHITLKTIQSIKEVKLKIKGRSRTLPASFVFRQIQDCYEFIEENQSSLLSACLDALEEGSSKSVKCFSNKLKLRTNHPFYDEAIHGHLGSSERLHWFNTDAINCVSEDWIKKGIKQVNSFDVRIHNRHQRIRDNESLFDLFHVLQGSLQFLTGAIMARRQDELVKLKPYGNLIPNKNPYSVIDEEYLVKEDGSKKNFKTQYSLKFQLKKSGHKGENETIERPIPTSIAKFIWRLEEFNRKAQKAKINKGKLSLFNNLASDQCKLIAVNSLSFNNNLDSMCDYFETDLVLMDNGEYRRNYVRQHQLRRFFAMVFFWSKRFDGMDALRWMLGHTDMEHLYHYITESETGAVMNGVKAGVLATSVIDKNSQQIDRNELDKLRKLLAKNLTGDENKDIEILTLSETVNYYGDSDFNTVPHISRIEKVQAIENELFRLLEDDIISLEPNFFTVEAESGEKINTFNLSLQFNEID